jgi:hypothetical protein
MTSPSGTKGAHIGIWQSTMNCRVRVALSDTVPLPRGHVSQTMPQGPARFSFLFRASLIIQSYFSLKYLYIASYSGWFKEMASKSYWDYDKVNHKDGAFIPEGRVLIDTAKSFVYTEGGLKGSWTPGCRDSLQTSLLASPLGTLISSYEVYEALRRGVAVPSRKRDA